MWIVLDKDVAAAHPEAHHELVTDDITQELEHGYCCCSPSSAPAAPAPSLCSYKAMYHSAVTPSLAPCLSAFGV